MPSSDSGPENRIHAELNLSDADGTTFPIFQVQFVAAITRMILIRLQGKKDEQKLLSQKLLQNFANVFSTRRTEIFLPRRKTKPSSEDD
jgi:hypothetical protein